LAAAVVAAGGALLPWEYRRRGGLAEDDEGCKGLGSSHLLLWGLLQQAQRFRQYFLPFFFLDTEVPTEYIVFHFKQETFLFYLIKNINTVLRLLIGL
jgi:hypothetical protein